MEIFILRRMISLVCRRERGLRSPIRPLMQMSRSIFREIIVIACLQCFMKDVYI